MIRARFQMRGNLALRAMDIRKGKIQGIAKVMGPNVYFRG